MSEVIVFPDVEAALVTALGRELPGIPVLTRVPNEDDEFYDHGRPISFVRITRVGGLRTNLVTDAAQIVIEAWAPTMPEAAALGQLVRGLIFAMHHTFQAGVWVRHVEETAGLQSFPDPESGQPRYQFSVQIDTRGKRL